MSRNPLKGIALKTSLKTTLAVPFGGLLLESLLSASPGRMALARLLGVLPRSP